MLWSTLICPGSLLGTVPHINHTLNPHDLQLKGERIKYIRHLQEQTIDITILSSVNYENNKATRVQSFNGAQGFVNRVKRH